jgi:hypothetical protein
MAPCREDLYTVRGSWKCSSSFMACILTRHVTHWACLGCSGPTYTTGCSSSRQYRATLHSHWRGVEQHYTGHNQQPDQRYAKEMCRAAWGKWWSHQILTGFLIHTTIFYYLWLYLWPTYAYLYSQACGIYGLGPNELYSIDWFLYMNLQLSKILEIVACCVYIFIQYIIYSTFFLTYIMCRWISIRKVKTIWLTVSLQIQLIHVQCQSKF